jgi:hypothetical protein
MTSETDARLLPEFVRSVMDRSLEETVIVPN